MKETSNLTREDVIELICQNEKNLTNMNFVGSDLSDLYLAATFVSTP